MTFQLRLLIRLRPVLRFVKFRVLHINDSPQRIARGIATGFFVAYLPVFGLHMLLALLLAQLIRANKAIAVMAVWICNPLTFVMIYYPCYRLGHLLLPFIRNKPQVELDQLQTLIDQVFSIKYMLVHFFTAGYWKQVWAVFTEIGLETCIGGIILGLIVAVTGYWIAYYFVIGYRTRKKNRKNAWKQTR